MNQRDKAILSDLERFRVLSRDDIIELHFSGLKTPVTQANSVLKRLRRDGYIEANTDPRKYLYFPSPAPIKKDSQKIPHFLAIADFYRQLRRIEEPRTFEVEPKLGKGMPEPDIFTIWSKMPIFVEIQRQQYGREKIEDKMKRYETYYYSDEWHALPWQPQGKQPIFPRVLIVGEARYNLEAPFRIHQATNAAEFLEGRKSEQNGAMQRS
jgi:hypothetical protein